MPSNSLASATSMDIFMPRIRPGMSSWSSLTDGALTSTAITLPLIGYCFAAGVAGSSPLQPANKSGRAIARTQNQDFGFKIESSNKWEMDSFVRPRQIARPGGFAGAIPFLPRDRHFGGADFGAAPGGADTGSAFDRATRSSVRLELASASFAHASQQRKTGCPSIMTLKGVPIDPRRLSVRTGQNRCDSARRRSPDTSPAKLVSIFSCSSRVIDGRAAAAADFRAPLAPAPLAP